MNVIVPLNKKVIVEPEAKEEKTQSGIIIPETTNQKAPTKGTIIAIAEDSDIKLKISAGDVVLFSKFAGVEIILPKGPGDINGKDRKLLIMKDEDILAVIQKQE